jgi:hypothetical protein
LAQERKAMRRICRLLEPCAEQLAGTVLRGGGIGDSASLPAWRLSRGKGRCHGACWTREQAALKGILPLFPQLGTLSITRFLPATLRVLVAG